MRPAFPDWTEDMVPDTSEVLQLGELEAPLSIIRDRWIGVMEREHCLVFGDVNPNNILVRPSGELVFIDPAHFGVGHRSMDIKSFTRGFPTRADFRRQISLYDPKMLPAEADRLALECQYQFCYIVSYGCSFHKQGKAKLTEGVIKYIKENFGEYAHSLTR